MLFRTTTGLLYALVLLAGLAMRPAAAADLPRIEFEQYQLVNGLNVILHVDHKMPAVNVNLWYHVGSKNEATGKTGFAHLFEHMMFQGSKHVEGEYLTLVERAGASLSTGGVNGTTNSDRTNYFQTVPTPSLEYALWLESDRMGFLLDALSEESFRNQQEVVKNEKRQSDNRPYSSLEYVIAGQMYPAGHPYGHSVIGSMEDLDNATLEDVRQFFRTYYAPNNASLVLSGSFDPGEARKLVQKYFGPLPSGPSIVRARRNVPRLDRDITVVSEERVPQPRLVLVWHAPPVFDAEEAPLDLAAEILGEGKNSRLYRRLVRDEKLATRVSVYNAAREISGLLYIDVLAVPDASLERIHSVIMEEVKRLADKGPTSDELVRRKASHEYRFVSGLERIGGFGGKADRLNAYYTYLGDADGFERDFERYSAVTADAVAESLGRWARDAHHMEVHFLPDPSGRPDTPDFDRTQAPAIASELPFEAPEVQSTTLDNGLPLYVYRRPDLPKVEVSLLIKRGDLGEGADNAGLSYMTTAVVDEGTATRGALDIQAELEALGARLNSRGDKYGSVVRLSSLRRTLPDAFKIMADVVLNPSFPETELEIVREQRLNAIRQEQNDPASLAATLFPRLLFDAAAPEGIAAEGTEASIARLTAEQLAESHATFWRPNNAALVIAGDIDLEEARRLAQAELGGWVPADLPPRPQPAPQLPDDTRVYLVDLQGAAQSQIRIGTLAPPRNDPNYMTLQLMNGLIGGTFSSRLNLNLREDKGYSYGAFSSLVQRQDYGYWNARAGVASDVTGPSLVEFRREIEGMAGERPISGEELDGLKRNLALSYTQKFETLAQLLGQVTPLLKYGVGLDFIDGYIDGVQAQQPGELTEAAREYLQMKHMVVLVVGDLATMEQAVRDLDWGKVTVLDVDGTVIDGPAGDAAVTQSH